VIGKTISHYRILEKLGGGGMGVVYKAEDTKLGRTVALKVLPPERVADPNRKRRFIQEARAASALNHPNIITIYDIDEAEGVHYIAMEHVEGKTLDRLIARHGLRVNEALKYAVQMAAALAKAHSAGIVHRDLKPTNVMVTDDGLVKVLDFGLAKLTEAAPASDAETAVTREPATEEGTIVGTVGYMSPEQAEGKAVDARSDIFSFGSVLYEMLTGQRAFQGETKVSTIAAILREEPKPLSQVAEGLPREVERLVKRCLRKDREHRLQTMADLKVALEELKEESDSGELADKAAVVAGLPRHIERGGVKPPLPRRLALAAIAAVVIVVALGVAGWYWYHRSRATPQAPLTAVPLTSYPGREETPSFSPEGNQVAFSWNGEKQDNYDIYVKQIGVEPPSRLTNDPAPDVSPAWSPDGRTIAFLRQFSPTREALILIPQRGGRERLLEELDLSMASFLPWSGPYLAWTPDSKWLACPVPEAGRSGSWTLYLFSVETGEKRKLTNPPPDGDTAPAFSADGRILAFARLHWPASDLCLLRLGEGYKPQGEPERVPSENPYNIGVAWTPDGSEIIFSSGIVFSSISYTSYGLWRVAASGSAKPGRLPFVSENVRAPAISRQGNRLAYAVERSDTNIWRVELRGPDRKPGVPVKLISSTWSENNPDFSPDGKKIAFKSNRSGASEIWLCDSDGSNPEQFTSFGGSVETWGTPRWSPDGQSIALDMTVGGNQDVYVINAKSGVLRRLTTSAAVEMMPEWSRDGKWIYFCSGPKHMGEIWKMPASGGEVAALQITRKGGDQPQESPDGKSVYYCKGWPNPLSVWRIPVEGGEGTKVLDGVHPEARWTVGGDGIYFFTKPDERGHSALSIYEFATGKTRKILTVERPVTWSVRVSRDGRTVIYPQVDETGSDLMLVENFR
jgi:serine/threonine protein kinase